MHIPSFPSTRSLEGIHVSNVQVLIVAVVSLVLLALSRSLLALYTRLRSPKPPCTSKRFDDKAPQLSQGDQPKLDGQKPKSWKWTSGFGFGLQLESFPIALNATHQLGLTPPTLGSGVGVLNLKMGAPTVNNQTAPTVRGQARSNGVQLVQPKLAKTWYMQHAKSMRTQSAPTVRHNRANLEAPAPAPAPAARPVSMAKMIMSRHTFRRPTGPGPRRAPLLPSSRRHDVIFAQDGEPETFYDAPSQSSASPSSDDPSPNRSSPASQNDVPSNSMV